MTKPILIALAVLLLSTAAWMFFAPATTKAPTSDEVTTTNEGGVREELVDNNEMNSPFVGEGTATFAALIESGGSYRCTFTSNADGVKSSGDLYTDGERFRVTAETTVEGEVVMSDMINNGATTYVWSETAEGTMGMMMANDLSETIPTGVEMYPGDTTGVDMEQDVSYNCEAWTGNESFFTPPSNVEFVDMQAMMQGMQDAFGTMQ